MEESRSKKSIIFIVIGLVIVFALGLLIGIMLGKGKKEEPTPVDPVVQEKKDFEYHSYNLGVYDDVMIEGEYELITSSSQLRKFIDFKNIKEVTDDGFQDNNYVLVQVSYDACSESDLKVKDYEVKDDVLVVHYTYKANCGVCAPQYMYFLFRVPKDVTIKDVDLKYESTNTPECDPYVSYKPMIYIYPTKKMNVEVKLGYPELLITTYPKYNKSWKVVANPNGDLYDENGKYYYGLYWEGFNSIQANVDDGFVVKGSDSAKFLEEKLAVLGLNEKEANEFIVYWLPKLEENKYNFIRFENIDIINREMPLEVSPAPDTMIRILMEYKPLDQEISVKEQLLTKVERKGYTVVEWGGTLLE